MLDIVISPDMSTWEWKDEDEFIESQKEGHYSIEKAREIWAEGERAIRLTTLPSDVQCMKNGLDCRQTPNGVFHN
ncbi:MAG: DUF402 domain-containing protein [Anaerolineales bacterium]|nr:DUF402 domain-containing protein [Anaerolineales bacterium]